MLYACSQCQEDLATGTLSDGCKVTLYTVCVEKCPRAGDIVCNYEREARPSPCPGPPLPLLRHTHCGFVTLFTAREGTTRNFENYAR